VKREKEKTKMIQYEKGTYDDRSMLMKKREFLRSALAIAGTAGAAPLFRVQDAFAARWTPSDIRYGYSGIGWGTDVGEAINETARIGLQGLEGHGPDWRNWFNRPLELKRLFDAAGISMVSCSRDLDFFVRTSREAPAIFVDEAKIPQMISEHVAFARDFIKPFGCNHFKFTLGGRPEGGPNDTQLKIISDALNEIGKRTASFGMRLAPHPHIGGTVILEHEIRTVMELTDPQYVWLVTDTAHLALAGMDPLTIIRDYYPRVAEVHYKDVPARYRGWKGPAPKSEMENGESLFQPMGTGGVDFPPIHSFLLGKKYNGWILLDYEAPRPSEGIGTFEDTILHNKNYLVSVLHVNTLKPAVIGHSACAYSCISNSGTAAGGSN
jgi:sugar phosphate isomerase/epimerase